MQLSKRVYSWISQSRQIITRQADRPLVRRHSIDNGAKNLHAQSLLSSGSCTNLTTATHSVKDIDTGSDSNYYSVRNETPGSSTSRRDTTATSEITLPTKECDKKAYTRRATISSSTVARSTARTRNEKGRNSVAASTDMDEEGPSDSIIQPLRQKFKSRSRIASIIGLALFRQIYAAELDAHVSAVTRETEIAEEEEDSEEEEEEEVKISGPPYSHEAELSILRCYDELLKQKIAAAYPKHKRILRPTLTPNRAAMNSEKRIQQDEGSFFVTEMPHVPHPPIQGASRKKSAGNDQKTNHRRCGKSPGPASHPQECSRPGFDGQETQQASVTLKTRDRIYRAGALLDLLKKDLGETVTNPRCMTPCHSAKKKRRPRPRSRALVREYNLWTTTWARRH